MKLKWSEVVITGIGMSIWFGLALLTIVSGSSKMFVALIVLSPVLYFTCRPQDKLRNSYEEKEPPNKDDVDFAHFKQTQRLRARFRARFLRR